MGTATVLEAQNAWTAAVDDGWSAIDDGGMRTVSSSTGGRWIQAVAWAVVTVMTTALVAGAVLLAFTGFEVAFYPAAAVGAVGCGVVGAFAVTRRRHPLPGWLLLAFATGLTVTLTLRQAAWFVFVNLDGDLAVAQWLIAIADGLFGLWLACLLLLFLTFPDGRLSSPRWWPVVAVLFATGLTGAVATVFASRLVVDPEAYLIGTAMTNDAGVASEAEPLLRLFDVISGVMLALFVLSIVSLITRFRRVDDDQRQRIVWVVPAAVAWLLIIPIATGQRADTRALQVVQDALGGLAFVVLAGGFAIALFRHRLWDVEVVVRRSVVYGALWLGITAVYAVVAIGLGVAAGARFPVELAILITVLATLVFQPARRWLEHVADRWAFGRRESPVEAVRGFGEVVDTARQPADIANHLAAAAAAMGLACAEVEIDGSASARRGTRAGHPMVVVPIGHGGTRFGELRYQQPVGRSLTPEEERLLEALSAQAGLAISHARLASRIVHAHETERRRIERDLHDGAQQELVGLLAQISLARSRVNGDAGTRETLTELHFEAQQILSSLRALAQGIHPTVLSDGGIVEAVQDRCSRLPIGVDLVVEPELRGRRFGRDVEGAAYFFVAEALTNALKHAQARTVRVRLGMNSRSVLAEVFDDGTGFDTDTTHQRGLAGLADRLRALGGRLEVRSSLGGGTHLTAELPIARAPREPS